jgi:anti-sigma B factor antagonist
MATGLPGVNRDRYARRTGVGSDSGQLRQPPVSGVETLGGALVVHLVGELDLYNAGEVRSALEEAADRKPERLVVDLAEVEFVDSTVLGVLIEGRRRLENNRAFLIAAPGREVRRALEVSGLDRHLNVHESIDEALAAAL